MVCESTAGTMISEKRLGRNSMHLLPGVLESVEDWSEAESRQNEKCAGGAEPSLDAAELD